MDNTNRPLSKRSWKLLQEASCHIRYAVKNLHGLASAESELLNHACDADSVAPSLADCIKCMEQLSWTINLHVASRS